MAEQLRPSTELTQRAVSSTLNARSTMPEPQKEQLTQSTASQKKTEQSRKVGFQADSIGEMMMGVSPQAAREAARAIVEAARNEGRSLTPEQRALVKQLGYEPVISGGADVFENEEWNPDDEGDGVQGRVAMEAGRHSDERSTGRNNRADVLRPILNFHGVENQKILDSIRLYNRQVEQGYISPRDDEGVLRIDKVIDRISEVMLEGGLNEEEKTKIESLLGDLEGHSRISKEETYKRRLEEERKRRRESPYQELINTIDEYKTSFAEDIEKEKNGDPVINPEFYAQKNRLVEALREQIKDAPSIETGHFPTELIDLALNFKETREQLINDIIFRSYEDPTEQGHYEINLYASGNLDQLLGGLSLRGFKEEYLKARRLRTSAQNFYEMNKTIGAGNIESFIRIAENINWTQFETMQQLAGVPLVMRLFEQKYIAKLGEKKTISSEAYSEIKKEVEETLIHLNEKGLVKSEYASERGGTRENAKLQDWEVERALNAGRAFFNITFRAAEQISLGQVPGVTAEKGYKQFASYPQESASRIMNPVIWTITRFAVAEGKGGDVFNRYVKDEYKAYLEAKRRNLGKNRLKEVGGMSVEDLQVSGMMGISGFLSGWRLENLAYSGLRFGDGEKDNLRDWMDEKITIKEKDEEKEMTRAAVIDDLKKGKNSAKRLTMEERQKRLVEIFKPLLEDKNKGGKEMDVGLGVLLRLIAEREEVSYELRKYIWEKTAERNLPTMISYLSNIKAEEGKEKVIKGLSLNELRQNTVFDPATAAGNEKWHAFLQKVELEREMLTRKRIALRDKDGNLLRDARGKLMFESFENVKFDEPGEAEMKKAIIEAGKKISGDLADIYFGYVPFLNDVAIEEFQFSGPGEEAYRRRSAGDLGSFYKASGAYGAIVGNPGALKDEDALGKINEIEQGIESPNGVGSGQDAAFPVFSAYLKFVMTNPGERWLVLKGYNKTRLKPTSDAQIWNGTDALSLSEAQAFHLVEKARHLGFLGHSGEALLLKRRNLGFWDRLWEILRDYGPMAAGLMLVNTPRSAVSSK